MIYKESSARIININKEEAIEVLKEAGNNNAEIILDYWDYYMGIDFAYDIDTLFCKHDISSIEEGIISAKTGFADGLLSLEDNYFYFNANGALYSTSDVWNLIDFDEAVQDLLNYNGENIYNVDGEAHKYLEELGLLEEEDVD